MSENKIGATTTDDSHQLRKYLTFMDENQGATLNYNFFLSPSTGEVGPNLGFSTALVGAMVDYDIGFQIFNHAWWEVFQ